MDIPINDVDRKQGVHIHFWQFSASLTQGAEAIDSQKKDKQIGNGARNRSTFANLTERGTGFLKVTIQTMPPLSILLFREDK